MANKLDSRRTLIIANVVTIAGIIPMGFAPNINFAYAAAVIVGIGLGGLILIGIYFASKQKDNTAAEIT